MNYTIILPTGVAIVTLDNSDPSNPLYTKIVFPGLYDYGTGQPITIEYKPGVTLAVALETIAYVLAKGGL